VQDPETTLDFAGRWACARQMTHLALNAPAHRFAVLLRCLRDGATRRPTNPSDAKALKFRQRTPLSGPNGRLNAGR
jgi:hypothetical protein